MAKSWWVWMELTARKEDKLCKSAVFLVRFQRHTFLTTPQKEIWEWQKKKKKTRWQINPQVLTSWTCKVKELACYSLLELWLCLSDSLTLWVVFLRKLLFIPSSSELSMENVFSTPRKNNSREKFLLMYLNIYIILLAIYIYKMPNERLHAYLVLLKEIKRSFSF